jgi:hypothetical protein
MGRRIPAAVLSAAATGCNRSEPEHYPGGALNVVSATAVL